MLRDSAVDVRKHYYDPKFHGVDWDAVIEKAEDNISKADTLNAAVSEVAAALDALNDSHTFFMPPPRPYLHDYGFRMQMIGEHCYVIGVFKDSDAEKKSISIGDEILAINEHQLSRKVAWKLLHVWGLAAPEWATPEVDRCHRSSKRGRRSDEVHTFTGHQVFSSSRY